jgi:hypothetical protein
MMISTFTRRVPDMLCHAHQPARCTLHAYPDLTEVPRHYTALSYRVRLDVMRDGTMNPEMVVMGRPLDIHLSGQPWSHHPNAALQANTRLQHVARDLCSE